ncbi:MAG: PilW family protein, partial [Gammaproteobacteria bacterium]|nr:PilW family protein [Gammaproteobacteria bacterium]
KNKKAEVKGFKETAFFISDTRRVDKKNQPIYGLYSSINRGKKQELVSGVSEMQILYGVDIDGQGRVNKYLKASEVDDWDRVLIVMIGLKFQGLRLTKQKNIYIRLRGDG